MNLRELRIGNLVNDDRNILTEVYSIDTEINHDDLTRKYSYVPITTELLLNSGFEHIDFINNIKWSHLVKEKITIDKVGGNNPNWQIGINGNFSCLIFIQYFHQLQNLYFALTGEELTIK